jgi:transcriptional regulator GlxA family with amidase domain
MHRSCHRWSRPELFGLERRTKNACDFFLSLLLLSRQDICTPLKRGWTEVTKKGPQVTVRAPFEIVIVCYPGAQETCIHGLTDLFTYADYFARMHAAGSTASTPLPARASDQSFLNVTHQREHAAIETTEATDLRFDIVIVPASQLGPPTPNYLPQLSQRLTHAHQHGATIAAVCGGVFLLAQSGLLKGRRATTHWMFASELRQRFPDLQVDPDRIVIDEGDIVTAGGVLAWADMGLTLVQRLLGRTVMCSTARFMLMDPPGREQRFYGEFTPPMQHGDRAIIAIQQWLHANIASTCTVTMLAERAGLSSRTFLRRFVKATGMKPTTYHHQLRITRSRELLEFTRDTVDQIAAAAGYEDSRGFRRTFKRVIGLSPAEYRRRFHRPQTSNTVEAS